MVYVNFATYFYHIYDDIFISRHLGNFKNSEKKITTETFSFYYLVRDIFSFSLWNPIKKRPVRFIYQFLHEIPNQGKFTATGYSFWNPFVDCQIVKLYVRKQYWVIASGLN